MNRYALLLGILCALYLGVLFSLESLHVFATRNEPIVSGHIIARTPIHQLGIPRVEFTIQIDGSETRVHARANEKLLHEVPDIVQFHSSGNPSEKVLLFEYEENPYGPAFTCWASVLLLTYLLVSKRARKALGWLPSDSKGDPDRNETLAGK